MDAANEIAATAAIFMDDLLYGKASISRAARGFARAGLIELAPIVECRRFPVLDDDDFRLFSRGGHGNKESLSVIGHIKPFDTMNCDASVRIDRKQWNGLAEIRLGKPCNRNSVYLAVLSQVK